MDVRFSSEQQALRDAAAQMVDRLGPRAVRDLDDRERAAKLEAAVDATGWRELRAPADGGGPLTSGVEAAIVAEEMGRGLADVAFLGPTLAADLRRLAGAPPASGPETIALTADLSGVASEPVGSVAIDAHGPVQAILVVPQGGGYTLAQTSSAGDTNGTDLTRPTAVIGAGARSAPVPGADVDVSQQAFRAWTALGLALACADLVGIMRGAIGTAAEYACSRKQYGVPIGSFQAIQHLLADAQVAMEGSRSVALHAAWAVDAMPADDALVAASVAKAYCARAARSVCETAIQVHGGIGNTWECTAHVYLRRALLSADLLGGVGPCLARVLEHHGIGAGSGLR